MSTALPTILVRVDAWSSVNSTTQPPGGVDVVICDASVPVPLRDLVDGHDPRELPPDGSVHLNDAGARYARLLVTAEPSARAIIGNVTFALGADAVFHAPEARAAALRRVIALATLALAQVPHATQEGGAA